jgi:hypothetical protein
MKTSILLASLVCLTASSAFATTNLVVTQGEEFDLAVLYSSEDLLQGLIATELPGDKGWHSVNTDPLDQLPAFTDGEGIRSTGLTGLLADFPGAGMPAKRIEYALTEAHDISEIRIFTGNNGQDGRVFHTYTISFSSDGVSFSLPLYVQSHASGTLNNSQNNQWRLVLSQLTDDAGFLAKSVTHLRFDFYSVDNTTGQMRDPFDGVNSFTGLDDGLTFAFVSPLVLEIDVFGQLSPPKLLASVAGTNLNLVWITSQTGFVLQSSDDLESPFWADLTPQPDIIVNGNTNNTAIPITVSKKFYRLRQ